MGEWSDEELLLAVRAGDVAAFEQLYDRYQVLAMALAHRLLGARPDAEETVMDAFLAVWRRADTFQPGRGCVRAWLCALVRNRAIDRLRARGPAAVEGGLEAVAELADARRPDPAEAACRASEQEQVRAALAALPPEQRRIVELAYFAGYTQREIADAVGIPLGTVKSRLRLALEHLKRLLDDA